MTDSKLINLGSSTYRPEIDGLRALAVVSVIIHHFNPTILPSGYLGVDIFFVISGFVITASLGRPLNQNFGDFLLRFYSRRMRRLVPALVLFVVVISTLICLFNPEPNESLEIGHKTLLGIANISLYNSGISYFTESADLNVFTHTWSLGVEEQFYILFPWLAWMTGFSRLTVRGARNLAWTIGLLSIASLLSFIYFYPINPRATYFLMPSRAWEIGAGCLLYLGLNHSKTGLKFLTYLSPVSVTIAIIFVLFTPLKFAVTATLMVVFLTGLLIACLRKGTLGYQLFTHPRVVYIGLISYSLYLWHWGVLSISRWTIGIHEWSVPFQLALMLLLSIASYRYIETPCRHSSRLKHHWKSIGTGIAASVGASIFLVALVSLPNGSLYAGHTPSLIAIGGYSLTDSYSLEGTPSTWKGKDCVLSENSHVGKKISIENCTLGDFATAKRRVLVIGNSFSASFVQSFDELVRSDHYAVTITSSWAASPVPQIPNKTPMVQANTDYWNRIVPSLISQLKQNDWVFLLNDMEQFSPQTKTPETNLELTQLEQGLEILSGQLSANKIHFSVFHGNPFAREAKCKPVVETKPWFAPFGEPCQLPNRKDSLLRRSSLNARLTSLESQGKLAIVDAFDIFCPEEHCTYRAKNGQILYRDEHSHPSVEAARLSAPLIRKVLTSQ